MLAGELVVVVFGILIALWVDGSIQRRQDRELEQRYLTSLLADFDSVTTWLDGFGASFNRRKEAEARALERLLVDRSETLADTMATAYGLAYLGFYPLLPVTRSTFDDLTGTGNLKVLTNQDLRHRLVDFFAWLDLIRIHEAVMAERNGELKKLISRQIPPGLAASLAEFGWTTSGEVWRPIDELEVPDELRSSAARSLDLDRLRGDPSLLPGLSLALDDLLFQRRQYEMTAGRAHAVLEALQLEVR